MSPSVYQAISGHPAILPCWGELSGTLLVLKCSVTLVHLSSHFAFIHISLDHPLYSPACSTFSSMVHETMLLQMYIFLTELTSKMFFFPENIACIYARMVSQ